MTADIRTLATSPWIILGLAAIYFAPAVIALMARSPRLAKVVALNTLLGWTVVGWAMALALALRRGVESGEERAPSSEFTVARGAGGMLAFNGRQVGIDRSGSVSFLMHGMSGPRLLEISALRSVRFRPAARSRRGYLRLVVAGAPKRAVAADENAVLFDLQEQPGFEALAAELTRAIRTRRRRGSAAPPAEAPPRLTVLDPQDHPFEVETPPPTVVVAKAARPPGGLARRYDRVNALAEGAPSEDLDEPWADIPPLPGAGDAPSGRPRQFHAPPGSTASALEEFRQRWAKSASG